ncbi:MAG: glutamate synthase [Alphaproteobacteria bacterium]|nr:glutamate synthase [Alphaproteobacteria bacterium]
MTVQDSITVDLAEVSVRDLNQRLHHLTDGGDADWQILNPRGQHAIAVGLMDPVQITIDGPVGYYCGGMNQNAQIVVNGHSGWGVAENIMSGVVRVRGNASESAAATGRAGLVVIEGDASSRCGVSMKGVDIVVGGSVGHMSGFLAQTGRMAVCGDAGADLGSSIYEAVIYVRGDVESLGADCIEKEMTDAHISELAELLTRAEVAADPSEFRRYGSARNLYHFKVDHADAY